MKSFLYFIILFFLFGCNKKKLEDSAASKKLAWFKDSKNYKNNKEYRSKFLTTYNGYLYNKQYDAAKVLLNSFGEVVYYTFEYDSLYFNSLEQFLSKNYILDQDTTYANLHYLLSWEYSTKTDYKKAFQLADKCLEINKLRSKNIHLAANKLIGGNYTHTAQPEKAIKIFGELLPLAEQENRLKTLGSLNYNMGYAYDMLHAYTESEKLYKKAAQYFLAAKDTTTYFAQQCYNAKEAFNYKKDTLSTIKFIDTLLHQFKAFKQPRGIDSSSINKVLTLKYLLKNDYDLAFYYNNKNLKFSKNDKFTASEYLLFDNEIYFQKYKKLKDKNQLIKLLNEFLASDDNFRCIDIYKIFYQNALIENNTKEALFYRNKEIELSEALLKNNQKGQLFEFEKKYQSEKKEKEIAQQKAEISNNKFIIIGLGLALLSGLFGLLLYNSKKRKQEAQAETIRQEQFTFQLLQNTEEERSRIAGELHDSVNHDLLNIKNTLINGKTIAVNDVESVIEEVRNISRNLHPAVLETIGLEASIEALCEKVSEIGLFTTCEVDYQVKFSKSKEVQLYRIIQEALNNTLKHGKADAAKVILTSQTDGLQLEIKDNGNGFDVAQELNNPKSFGLQSIIQRAKAIAAKINIDSTNKGTVIQLNMPV